MSHADHCFGPEVRPGCADCTAGVDRALRDAGWPSVADDLAEGVEPQVILSRLRRMADEDTDEAERLVAALTEPAP